MPTEISVAIIIGVTQICLALAGGIWAVRRFKVERVGIEAEANQDNATAIKSWVDTYNKIIKMIQERDDEILQLRKRIGEQDVRIDKLSAQYEEQKVLLNSERKLRIAAEERLEELLPFVCTVDNCPLGNRPHTNVPNPYKPQQETT